MLVRAKRPSRARVLRRFNGTMIDPRSKRSGAVDSGPKRSRSWVIAHIWASGPDTTQDHALRLLAMRHEMGIGWTVFDRALRPPSGLDSHQLARLELEFGAEFAGTTETADSRGPWADFRDFLGDGPILTLEEPRLRAWSELLAQQTAVLPATIGLVEIAGLLLPGRLSQQGGERLLELLLERRNSPPAAIFPTEVLAALHELLGRFRGLNGAARTLISWAWERAISAFSVHDGGAAQVLRLARELLEVAPFWQETTARDTAEKTGVHDPVLPALADETDAELLLATLEPRWAHQMSDWQAWEPSATTVEPLPAFDEKDEAVLERVFREHLPRLFAGPLAPKVGEYRQSQHEVAQAVAKALGGSALLLVHAPTGTGKTLAYLLPALLWSRRNGVRVGIATYTRALQEQAMEREVPQALRALVAAGERPGYRVGLLKGRENYLCWRAFLAISPSADDSAESWLAWACLLLFSLQDSEGDLDRFPLSPPIRLGQQAVARRAFEALVRNVRAQTACCSRSEDRQSCAAELARRRAERCHVVLTNHAFALHRTEFFRHLIFDECEHLHDQALSAWSHKLALRSVRNLLGMLHRPRKEQSRAVLDRLARALLAGSPALKQVEQAIAAWEGCWTGIESLQYYSLEFETWRLAAEQTRAPREHHTLLREYAESERGIALLSVRQQACATANDLDRALAELSERLESMPVRGRASLRRSLELARTELADWIAALESWLPVQNGVPELRRETFYDVEFDAQGEAVLHARVLLPNEYLARNYYPSLTNAVFLSATTWLRSSFDGALGYLGLDRAAAGDEENLRPPRQVETMRAPEVFDYSRVLLAIPRDAPPASEDKARYLQYVRGFLATLGEQTRGRILALFTNQQDVAVVGEDLAGFFRARRIPLWYQGMDGLSKEELSDLFRQKVDSILLGVDTFWYGADFPGETLEYLVIVRLPYGVPDRYHQAQCAALGQSEQRRRIYLPRAAAKFRQGFGRLMRKHSDRGVVFVLDQRILDPRHRFFLAELPVQTAWKAAQATASNSLARLVRASTIKCLEAGLAHMGLGLRTASETTVEIPVTPPPIPPPKILLEDLPF